MGDNNNQDPWGPGGSAWLTIAGVITIIASLSALGSLIDPRPVSPRFGPSAAYAEERGPLNLANGAGPPFP